MPFPGGNFKFAHDSTRIFNEESESDRIDGVFEGQAEVRLHLLEPVCLPSRPTKTEEAMRQQGREMLTFQIGGLMLFGLFFAAMVRPPRVVR